MDVDWTVVKDTGLVGLIVVLFFTLSAKTLHWLGTNLIVPLRDQFVVFLKSIQSGMEIQTNTLVKIEKLLEEQSIIIKTNHSILVKWLERNDAH